MHRDSVSTRRSLVIRMRKSIQACAFPRCKAYYSVARVVMVDEAYPWATCTCLSVSSWPFIHKSMSFYVRWHDPVSGKLGRTPVRYASYKYIWSQAPAQNQRVDVVQRANHDIQVHRYSVETTLTAVCLGLNICWKCANANTAGNAMFYPISSNVKHAIVCSYRMPCPATRDGMIW